MQGLGNAITLLKIQSSMIADLCLTLPSSSEFLAVFVGDTAQAEATGVSVRLVPSGEGWLVTNSVDANWEVRVREDLEREVERSRADSIQRYGSSELR
jgi:hypothetical protein